MRVSHSAVVGEWRRREAELRRLGVDVALVSAKAWDEGGRRVVLQPEPGVTGAHTWGRHPYRFVYDPRPVWRALRSGPIDELDVLDVHEEPAALATAEVLALEWLSRRLPGRGRRRGRARVCLYSAQNIAKRYPPPFRWFERWALRRADGVHSCNAEAGRIVVAKGFSGMVADLGLGVDPPRGAPPGASPAASGGESSSHSNGPLRVGYVGRLESFKGVDVAVRAVAAVADAELVVVGDGPERGALVALADRSGVADRVRFRGPVDHDDLGAVYAALDVVVVPSLETPAWVEQFGRVAVEAMASGVAVVVSDSGALPEVVGDGAEVVPWGDPDALAAVLARLAVDPTGRARLAAAGRARAGHFTWAAVAARHRALYDEVVA
nr:glycosyltransferase [Rhabdothermincola salaria]